MGAYIQIRNVCKQFYGVYALRDISFDIEQGSVHAIMGENGAGKSTLMKILGGAYQADGGTISIGGRERSIKNVRDADECGISVIYQEFNLVPELTVAENIFISDIPKKTFFGIVEKKKRSAKAKELLDFLEINVGPDEYVKDLSVSEKQMVEIAKSISRNSDIIIMDEPTAALNEEEVEKLEEVVHMLRNEGKTILYISHRLKEVFDMADTVTVLRNGEYVDTKPISKLTEADIIKLMVGHEIDHGEVRPCHATDHVLLEVRGLTLKNVFEDVSFCLHQGEILGAAGLMGCGREEVLSAIYGLFQYDSGQVFLDGREVRFKNPQDAIEHGVCFLTDDRKDKGILPMMSVEENVTLISIRSLKKKFGFYIDPKSEQEQLRNMTDFMAIKYANAKQKISYLSGGNQQKALLGRDLLLDNRVFIMLEPTRGIDVGAKEEIYNLLSELARNGMGIIAVFSDMNELIKVCDRVIVFCDGRVTGGLTRDEFNKERILTFASGKEA
ncbi:sugar ABC transporter ATP-binding protein [Ruminococcus sp. OA3]|uniref:sugar ABC transporter ATP-binding protein n=1 Tax=Ruminococcus sp. OA3 TaxID=2914164 RepID=UPI001F06E8EE|nr:sugar ABC transporter ATP-binding protein [Ruminococcus sp. OA3]